MSRWRVLLLLLVSMNSYAAVATDDLEQAVCGNFKEPLMFQIWSSAAGSPKPAAAAQISNAETVSFTTKDGRRLAGYHLKSTAANGSISATILLAQGNATLADQLLRALRPLNSAGIEIYLFDYRGYGLSEGERRLKAMISDYAALAEYVRARAGATFALYGVSFGGVVLTNAIRAGVQFDKMVIDSSPSRVSEDGCPRDYDPVENLPNDASRFLVIAGGKDKVVTMNRSQELVATARTRGGRVEVREEFNHPFMDTNIAAHIERLEIIKSFIVK
jgi:alpha/beta superfamily hydrolase